MFKFRSDIVFRFNLVVILAFITFAFVIIGNAVVIMFKDRETWNQIKERYVQDNVPIPAERGRILDENGELIISSLPYYKLRIDFKYINNDNQKDAEETRKKRKELWDKHLVEVSEGLNEIFPGESAESFEKRLRRGIQKEDRYFRLYRGKISYTQYNRLMKLPVFREGEKYSGLFFERDEDFIKEKEKRASIVNRDKIDRKNIFGDVGVSTFGILRETYDKEGNMDVEISGLEAKYNEYLSGKPGVGRKETNRKGKSITTVKKAPVNGMDLQTTINTDMLDICESELKKVLEENSLAAGWAILMETKTGDIKAIVNLTKIKNRYGEYEYIETIENVENNPTKNHALCSLHEPGSIFKTVALTAILTDKKLTVKDSVTAYRSKSFLFSGSSKPIEDAMYRNNGTGKYSMSDAMMYSSNISLIQYIRKAYGDCPSEYANTIKRFGLTENYNLIPDEATPRFTMPGTKDWNGFTLSSLSMGYAVEMTAINMVSFYNTIANDGVQMRPRLVKAVIDNGKVVKEFPTEVINSRLFPKEVADTMTSMLVKVVNGLSIDVENSWRFGKRDGTGASAYSEMMTIAGKTGTAKKYDGKSKLLSFCGFFPAENPRYSLIVQTLYDADQDTRSADKRNDLGGGSTSAIAFRNIAERVMAKELRSDIQEAKDKPENMLPLIKSGNSSEATGILNEMGIAYSMNGEEENAWGELKRKRDGKGYDLKVQETDIRKMPDLTGMGAKDAVYLLHRRKQKVILNGYGTVKRQSIPAGSSIVEGNTVTLTLEQ